MRNQLHSRVAIFVAVLFIIGVASWSPPAQAQQQPDQQQQSAQQQPMMSTEPATEKAVKKAVQEIASTDTYIATAHLCSSTYVARDHAAKYLRMAKSFYAYGHEAEVVLTAIHFFEQIINTCHLEMADFYITPQALINWKQHLQSPAYTHLLADRLRYERNLKAFEQFIHDLNAAGVTKTETSRTSKSTSSPKFKASALDDASSPSLKSSLRSFQKLKLYHTPHSLNCKPVNLPNLHLGKARDQGDTNWCAVMSSADVLSYTMNKNISSAGLVLLYYDALQRGTHSFDFSSMLNQGVFSHWLLRLYLLNQNLHPAHDKMLDAQSFNKGKPLQPSHVSMLNKIERTLTRYYKTSKSNVAQLARSGYRALTSTSSFFEKINPFSSHTVSPLPPPQAEAYSSRYSHFVSELEKDKKLQSISRMSSRIFELQPEHRLGAIVKSSDAQGRSILLHYFRSHQPQLDDVASTFNFQVHTLPPRRIETHMWDGKTLTHTKALEEAYLLYILDQQLNNNNIVEVAYRPSMLFNQPVGADEATSLHSSTIVGRRCRANGRTEYLLRNTFGDLCSRRIYNREKQDWESIHYQYSCKQGHVWVPRDALGAHLWTITYIE